MRESAIVCIFLDCIIWRPVFAACVLLFHHCNMDRQLFCRVMFTQQTTFDGICNGFVVLHFIINRKGSRVSDWVGYLSDATCSNNFNKSINDAVRRDQDCPNPDRQEGQRTIWEVPKTDPCDQAVIVPPYVMDALDRYRGRMMMDGHPTSGDNRVFVKYAEKIINRGNLVSMIFKPLCKKAGVPCPGLARNAAHDRYAATGERNSDQQCLGIARSCQFSRHIANLRTRHKDRHGEGDGSDCESVSASGS